MSSRVRISQPPRVAVLGAGSIGRRHIQNLLTLGADTAACRLTTRTRTAGEELPETVLLLDEPEAACTSGFDAVVIATETSRHISDATAVARAGQALFIEKPLSDSLAGLDELSRLCATGGLVVETGLMLRFHPNLQWIKAYLEAGELGDIHYGRALIGQHLPGWRPGTDHRSSYSARRSGGGGVIFDLVHELDLARWMFGEIAYVAAMKRDDPSLEIETEAIAQIGLQSERGPLMQITLDYVRPAYARLLEIIGSKGVLTWNYVEGTVSIDASGTALLAHSVPEGFDRNAMFLAHMRHFLLRLSDSAVPAASSLLDGEETLRLALASHASAEEQRFVSPHEIDGSYKVENRPI